MGKRLLYILLLLISSKSYASHLVGGELTYKCMGGNDYEVTLIIYRDCFSSGAGFDAFASITIYDATNTIVQDVDVPMQSNGRLPIEAPNNCSSLPPFVCTEKAVYRFTANLPPRAGGYVITHQRCCRNATIRNVNNSDDWGNTYYATIPDNDVACNSSPVFNDTPPVVLCLNYFLNLDMSATDPDNDSLHYELCDPLHGGGKNQTSTGFDSPKPGTAAPPPYTKVPYSTGFSAAVPITSSNPVIAIDPQTGLLKGRPTQAGQYVFAICVSEYRNGVLLGTIRRDFQFNVSSECKGTVSQIENQILNPNSLCNGTIMDFNNLSINATTFFWDFGDPTSDGDTSRAVNPTYTYADTGTYTVTLIANPGDVCADTSEVQFKVYFPLSIKAHHTGDLCFDSHAIDFFIEGEYSTEATFQWTFGGATSQGTTSAMPEPGNIQYLQPGTYYVEVKAEDYGCTVVKQDTVRIVKNPELKHTVPSVEICQATEVQFSDQSTAFGSLRHFWDFGDGQGSIEPNPVHTYVKPGLYTIRHSIQTTEGCLDSLFEEFPDHILVFPKPEAVFEADPLQTDIYNPNIVFRNLSSGQSGNVMLLPDGRRFRDFEELRITFEDTGTYPVIHYVENEFGCTDSFYQVVTIDAPLNIFIPNAFTPNNDGNNDAFKVEVTGATSFILRIFNRWGEMVFESFDTEMGWNGRVHNKGKEASAGIYTYQVIVGAKKNARDITRNGTINLLR